MCDSNFLKIFIYTGDTKQLIANTFGDTRLIGEIIREGGAKKWRGVTGRGSKSSFDGVFSGFLFPLIS